MSGGTCESASLFHTDRPLEELRIDEAAVHSERRAPRIDCASRPPAGIDEWGDSSIRRPTAERFLDDPQKMLSHPEADARLLDWTNFSMKSSCRC